MHPCPGNWVAIIGRPVLCPGYPRILWKSQMAVSRCESNRIETSSIEITNRFILILDHFVLKVNRLLSFPCVVKSNKHAITA